MTWLSPAFPIAHFLCQRIEGRWKPATIAEAATLQDWLASLLGGWPGFCEGVFLAHAHRAAHARRWRVARGRRTPKPSRPSGNVNGDAAQGPTSSGSRAALELRGARAPDCDLRQRNRLSRRRSACQRQRHGIPLAATMHGFLTRDVQTGFQSQTALGSFRSGQTDSQRVLSAMEPVVVAVGRPRLAGGARRMTAVPAFVPDLQHAFTRQIYKTVRS